MVSNLKFKSERVQETYLRIKEMLDMNLNYPGDKEIYSMEKIGFAASDVALIKERKQHLLKILNTLTFIEIVNDGIDTILDLTLEDDYYIDYDKLEKFLKKTAGILIEEKGGL